MNNEPLAFLMVIAMGLLGSAVVIALVVGIILEVFAVFKRGKRKG